MCALVCAILTSGVASGVYVPKFRVRNDNIKVLDYVSSLQLSNGLLCVLFDACTKFHYHELALETHRNLL